MPELRNINHERFAHFISAGCKPGEAYIQAGYKRNQNPHKAANKLLDRPEVIQRIGELQAESNKRTNVDADFVREKLAGIINLDVRDLMTPTGELLEMHLWPKEWLQFVTPSGKVRHIVRQDGTKTMTVELQDVKWPDRLKAIELLGRHVDIGAFKDKVEVSDGSLFAEVVRKKREAAE